MSSARRTCMYMSGVSHPHAGVYVVMSAPACAPCLHAALQRSDRWVQFEEMFRCTCPWIWCICVHKRRGAELMCMHCATLLLAELNWKHAVCSLALCSTFTHQEPFQCLPASQLPFHTPVTLVQNLRSPTSEPCTFVPRASACCVLHTNSHHLNSTTIMGVFV